MPLIRNAADKAGAAAPAVAEIEATLLHGAPDDRWAAARTIAGLPGGLQTLTAALAQEADPRVREAIFTGLVRIATPESAGVTLPYLRSDDAGTRTAALDALRAMPGAAQPHLGALLQDQDADVRILACEILRNLPASDATPLLCALLDSETVSNVCAAAVDVLAEIGTADAAPALMRCAARFPDDPFLGFAIKMATDSCRSHASNARE